MGKVFESKNKIGIICDTGAVGDTVASLVAIKGLYDRKQIYKLFVPKRFYDLFKLVFEEGVMVELEGVTKIVPKAEVTPDIPEHVINPTTGDAQFLDYPVDPRWSVVSLNSPALTPIHATLVDHFTFNLGRYILREDERDYVRVDEAKLGPALVEGDYVVLAYGATTEHRKMLPEVSSGLRDYFLGRGMKVVLLGRSDHELQVFAKTAEKTRPSFDGLDRTGCVDLIDKTTLVESLGVLARAKMVLGVDGGLIHLAGMTDTAIVAGFTTVDPYYRPIHRHGARNWNMRMVEPTSDCRYCQTNTFLTYAINFHRCQTGTKECMYSLTLDKWITQIEALLPR